MAGQIRKVDVKTGSASYAIHIGKSIVPSISASELLASVNKIGLVISARVYELHKDYITGSFADVPGVSVFIMDDDEENKSYSYAEDFLNRLIDAGFTRKSLIIGIGGGVVGDFAGYLAALYMRGIPIIHIPTTLLAMVDSSIGGKVAVNLAVGKNIAGDFHQPRFVLSDIQFLSTLPEKEFKNGLSEVFKHGLIGDSRTLEIMQENDPGSIQEDETLLELIRCSANFKASVVGKDETEKGIRAILNFGHTVGHAIESLMRYQEVSHGEAVAIGIQVEAALSKELGMLPGSDADKINDIINRYGLITGTWSLAVEDIISHMKYDKKNTNENINFVLLSGIGNPVTDQYVDDELLKNVLKKFF
ncbi:MAG: 3-dehydroquinate synthase [bacterium]|nr:3-dehydroquinate synthase [bacterium]